MIYSSTTQRLIVFPLQSIHLSRVKADTYRHMTASQLGHARESSYAPDSSPGVHHKTEVSLTLVFMPIRISSRFQLKQTWPVAKALPRIKAVVVVHRSMSSGEFHVSRFVRRRGLKRIHGRVNIYSLRITGSSPGEAQSTPLVFVASRMGTQKCRSEVLCTFDLSECGKGTQELKLQNAAVRTNQFSVFSHRRLACECNELPTRTRRVVNVGT